MSCPAVSCSKCVSGDVNWLRPCANSHLMLTKRNSVSPIGLFPSSVCFCCGTSGKRRPQSRAMQCFPHHPAITIPPHRVQTEWLCNWNFFSILLIVLQSYSPDTKTQTDTPTLFCWLQHYFSQTWEETIHHHQHTRCMATQNYTTQKYSTTQKSCHVHRTKGAGVLIISEGICCLQFTFCLLSWMWESW